MARSSTACFKTTTTTLLNFKNSIEDCRINPKRRQWLLRTALPLLYAMELEAQTNHGGRSCGERLDHNNNDKSASASASILRIFLVHVGLDLPKKRIALLSARAQEKGAAVLTQFRPPAAPSRKRRKRAWWKSAQENDQQKQQPPPKEMHQPEQPTNDTATLPTHLVIGEDCSVQQVADKLHFSSVDQFERFVRAVSRMSLLFYFIFAIPCPCAVVLED